MKTLKVLLLVITCSSLFEATQSQVHPASHQGRFFFLPCDPSLGPIEHPDSCHKYLQCQLVLGKYFIYEVKLCSPGKMFNPMSAACDDSSTVKSIKLRCINNPGENELSESQMSISINSASTESSENTKSCSKTRDLFNKAGEYLKSICEHRDGGSYLTAKRNCEKSEMQLFRLNSAEVEESFYKYANSQFRPNCFASLWIDKVISDQCFGVINNGQPFRELAMPCGQKQWSYCEFTKSNPPNYPQLPSLPKIDFQKECISNVELFGEHASYLTNICALPVGMSYSRGKSECERLGMQLVEVDSAGALKAVHDYVQEVFMNFDSPCFWTRSSDECYVVKISNGVYLKEDSSKRTYSMSFCAYDKMILPAEAA